MNYNTPHCNTPRCTNTIPTARRSLGYTTCLSCGERAAKQARAGWGVAPMNKSNYILVTDPKMLAQLNPKRTT